MSTHCLAQTFGRLFEFSAACMNVVDRRFQFGRAIDAQELPESLVRLVGVASHA